MDQPRICVVSVLGLCFVFGKLARVDVLSDVLYGDNIFLISTIIGGLGNKF